ncbi:unnamed protein product [Soboliphyme baturini]|uniref:HECT domain-containing protein n=1 Tax=Soboliphyme baturini TaxID=241478 RepID=A0A183IIG9_9BILA|nr:unnamed protein product [Soboliphyme baturini]
MKALIILSEYEVPEVIFEALETFLYITHLSYKAVDDVQNEDAQNAVVLRPFIDMAVLSHFYQSAFVKSTCRCLWQLMSNSFIAFKAACIFVWLHLLCRSSLCEDFLIIEMTSSLEERRTVALQNFVLLWKALREGHELLPVRKITFKPLLKATDVMLHGLLPTSSGVCICRHWFTDVLEHGDLHILLQMMCLEITRSDTFRVSPRFLTFSKAAVADDTAAGIMLFKLTTHTKHSLFHCDSVESCFVSDWATVFRKKYFQQRSTSDFSAKQPTKVFAKRGVVEVAERCTTANEELCCIECVVKTVLEEIVDYVEDVCQLKDCKPDRILFDDIIPEYLQFSTVGEYRKSNHRRIHSTLKIGRRSSSAPVDEFSLLHPVHGDWLLYYDVFDCSRVRHVFEIFLSLMDSCPAFFLNSLVYKPTVHSTKSYEQLIHILAEAFVRHEKAICGYECFTCGLTERKADAKIFSLPIVYLEIFISYSLFYIRSFYVNSPLSQVSEQQLRNNLSLKVLCLNFLSKCFREITVLVKRFGRPFAQHIINVFLSCRLQTHLMNCLIECVVDDGLLSPAVDSCSQCDDAVLLSVSILRFNYIRFATMMSDYRECLLDAIESLVETEHALRKCVVSGTACCTPDDSAFRSAFPTECYVPLTEKRSFVATVLCALRTERSRHPMWLKLVIHCVPYLCGSFPLLALVAVEQSFLNIESASKIYTHCCKTNYTTDLDVERWHTMPWNYVSTMLELVSKLFHQCITSLVVFSLNQKIARRNPAKTVIFFFWQGNGFWPLSLGYLKHFARCMPSEENALILCSGKDFCRGTFARNGTLHFHYRDLYGARHLQLANDTAVHHGSTRAGIFSGFEISSFQDIFQKLIDILTDIIGWQLNQSTWLKKTLVVIQDTEQDHILSVPMLRQSQSVGNDSTLSGTSDRRYNIEYSQEALNLISAHFVTMMDAVYRNEDKEKQMHVVNSVWTVILPFLKTRHVSNAKNFLSCCKLLVELSRLYLMKSLWRKHIVELIVDSSFFCMDDECSRQWSVIVDNVLSQDRMIFKEIMSKLAPSQNIFSSKEQEYDMRRNCLKRLSFILLSGEVDEYQAALPDIQERITDDLKVNCVPSVYSCLFLCFRVLVVRFSAPNLMSFWPSIVTELMQVLLQLEDYVNIVTMHVEDCRYKWIFTEVAYDSSSCNFSPFVLRVKEAFSILNGVKQTSDRKSFSVLPLKRITDIAQLAPFYLGLSRGHCSPAGEKTYENDTEQVAQIEASVFADLLEDWLF